MTEGFEKLLRELVMSALKEYVKGMLSYQETGKQKSKENYLSNLHFLRQVDRAYLVAAKFDNPGVMMRIIEKVIANPESAVKLIGKGNYNHVP